MLRRKEKMKWPRYSTWWDRNEFKINVVLWLIFFGLLLIARQVIVYGTPTFTGAMVWLFIFFLDLFCLSFFTNSVYRK